MMYEELSNWIDGQEGVMVDLITQWANINSHTSNLSGLKKLTKEIAAAFSVFNEKIEYIQPPSVEIINSLGEVESIDVAPILTLRKRPQAKTQIVLVCHMDTVFPKESDFQKVIHEGSKLKGPGVMDAKGGIVVMLKVLEALEQSNKKENFGWQVILNTDEEIGSPASADFLMQTAKGFDLGLVFEPCLQNGNLVGERKGSGNFTIVVKGVSAHAGRAHAQGRNAIEAAAECVQRIASLNHQREGLTINFGLISGGTALNVVPDLAIARFNVRLKMIADQVFVEQEVNKVIEEAAEKHEVVIQLHGKFFAPPKILDEGSLKIYKHIQSSGKALGLNIDWESSGGVCDGNRLASAGLPTVDTLGVRGGGMHSHQEYVEIASLTERVKLAVLSILSM